jgi:hypothetical protein
LPQERSVISPPLTRIGHPVRCTREVNEVTTEVLGF